MVSRNVPFLSIGYLWYKKYIYKKYRKKEKNR